MRLWYIIVILFFLLNKLYAQSESYDTWDNQIYIGNKISFGKNKIKFSGELQTRLKNNFKSLDNWFIEGVANYLPNKYLEIVPDFRISIKPTKVEYRPAIGLLLKKMAPNYQLINQIKFQADFGSDGQIGYSFRDVVFFNRAINEHVVTTLVTGFIYRWWTDEWQGFQYIRVGPGVSYIFDDRHILNVSYFIGVENKRDYWLWAGIPMLQLVINVTKKYTNTPAYYLDF